MLVCIGYLVLISVIFILGNVLISLTYHEVGIERLEKEFEVKWEDDDCSEPVYPNCRRCDCGESIVSKCDTCIPF